MTHSVFPGFVPADYFTRKNVDFLSNKLTNTLSLEFRQTVAVDEASILRVMKRVLDERIESVPRMNQRTLMYILNDFRTEQLETNKHLKWAANYRNSQALYDPTTDTAKIDLYNIKLANRLGKPKVGSTARFYFT